MPRHTRARIAHASNSAPLTAASGFQTPKRSLSTFRASNRIEMLGKVWRLCNGWAICWRQIADIVTLARMSIGCPKRTERFSVLSIDMLKHPMRIKDLIKELRSTLPDLFIFALDFYQALKIAAILARAMAVVARLPSALLF